MVFDFTPVKNEIHKALWDFKIPQHEVSVSFMLAGNVIEPRVAFDLPSINFGKVLLGARSKSVVKLVNQEHLPFKFAFNKATYEASEDMLRITGMHALRSLKPSQTGCEMFCGQCWFQLHPHVCPGKNPMLEFVPSKGCVPPHSSLEIAVCFTPQQEDAFNHNVVCNVSKKPQPLALNVKGQGYAIHASMQLDGQGGSMVEMAEGVPNYISFGQVRQPTVEIQCKCICSSQKIP